MHLKGSCHCQRVTFPVKSESCVPYMHCHCGICRKTGGGGGYAINPGADAKSLEVQGREHISIYHARMEKNGQVSQSAAERHFCNKCGTALWLFDPRWPDLIHPLASAIDTPLPKPDEIVRIMLDSRAPWVHLPQNDAQVQYSDFDAYPEESLADWHKRYAKRPHPAAAARRATSKVVQDRREPVQGRLEERVMRPRLVANVRPSSAPRASREGV